MRTVKGHFGVREIKRPGQNTVSKVPVMLMIDAILQREKLSSSLPPNSRSKGFRKKLCYRHGIL